MLLTPSQLREVQAIIRRHHSAFVVNYIDPKAVAPEVLVELEQAGLVDPKVRSVEEAYLLGQVAAALNDPSVKEMTLDELREHLKKNPVQLSVYEQRAVQNASQKAGQYAHGLGNRVDQKTGVILIEADEALRARLRDEVRTAVAENIAARETVKKLKSDLGWATRDWARDWDRIAVTEKHEAMQQGVADAIADGYGGDARVAKVPMPDACPHCRRLHLGPDGVPRIFKLSELEANGSNYGRKTAEWTAVVGAVHPHCQCQLVRVPTGWGFDESGNLSPGGELGQEYDAGDLERALRYEDDFRKSFQKADGPWPEPDRVQFQGIPIAIENHVGTYREWKDEEGREGRTLMRYAYGYVAGTRGADVDEVDVYIGPNPSSNRVFVVHQQNTATGVYDEEKCMLGFDGYEQARAAYLEQYDARGPELFVACSEMDVEGFKRWLALTRPAEGEGDEMVQKSGPRLVVPLQKGLAPEVGAATSRAGHRSPSARGTGVNLVIPTPERAIPPMHHGAKEFLEEVRDRDDDVIIRRDPEEDYEFDEPVPVEPKIMVLPDYAVRDDDDREAEEHMEALEAEFARNRAGEAVPREAEDRSLPPARALVLAKAATPVGGITPGGYKVVLDASGERQYVKVQKVQKPTHARYEVVDAGALDKPAVFPGFLQAGDAAVVDHPKHGAADVEMVGYSWEGRPVVKFPDGKQRTLEWKNVRAADPEDDGYRSVAENLPEGGVIVRPTPRQKKLVSRTLALEVAPGKDARAYADWLRERGNEVFLVGGIVRDLLAGVASGHDDPQVLEAMKDVDIVTTAHPGITHHMAEEVGGEEVRDNAEWGVVQILDGTGLDVAMISSERGQPHRAKRAVGDHDLRDDSQRRDFTCNCLYYDVHNDVVLDPTGTGVSDAENRILRLAPDLDKAARNTSLPLRFWKFRLRGYRTDPNDKVTPGLMKAMLPKMTANERKAGLIKILAKGGDPATVASQLREVMIADGAGDLYDEHLAPLIPVVITKLQLQAAQAKYADKPAQEGP